MEQTEGPRERLVTSTLWLLQERGVHGTGVAEVLSRSRTARGSIYQHFPAGKADLVRAAAERASDNVVAWTDAQRGLTAAEQLDAMVDRWVRVLERHDFGLGCPLAAVATDSPDEPALATVGRAFETWTRLLAESLDGDHDLAVLMVSALEGAILQCRASRSVQPLEAVRRRLTVLLAA